MSLQTEEIKHRLNIVDLIQTYVRLEKAGINFRGRCPFHQEKTPSFFVSPSRQTWHCFGCQKGGDHFTFVQEMEGMEFPEALKLLADRAGVKIVHEDPKVVSERSRLYAICEEAAKFFEEHLWDSANPNTATPMVKYLFGRGMTEKTIRDFRIGYAPDSWETLLTHLLRKGYRSDEIEKTGLAIKKDDSGQNRKIQSRTHYDRYRNRIIFPINDSSGRVVGFGGRVFPSPDGAPAKDGEAKYINSPETSIYNKSRILYAFDRAKNSIREKDFCVVVEGYMDTVMTHQAGITNTVAVSGTALTPEQLKIISRLTDKIIFAFDMDNAGQTATKRSLDLAAEFNFQRKVLILPSGKDPADAVRENPTQFLESLQKARPLMEYYFEEAGKRFNVKDPVGKRESGAFFLPYLRAITNEIERAHWVQKFSELLGVAQDAVQKELDKILFSRPSAKSELHESAPIQKQKSKRELLEERALSLLIAHFDAFIEEEKKFDEKIPFTVLFNERFYDEFKKEKTVTSDEFLPFYQVLQFRHEFEKHKENEPVPEIRACLRGIFREHYREKMATLQEQIHHLEKTEKGDRIKALLEEFKTLSLREKALHEAA